MIRLGMSIPTLPGGSKRPRSKHPGSDNMERELDEEKDTDSEDQADDRDEEPSVTPSSKPQTRIPFIKINWPFGKGK